MPSSPGSWFRLVALAEAVSWAGLLVGMLLKHVLDVTELGVQVFGPIHGGIFMAYLLVVALVRRPLGWSTGTTLLALVASVPPFATAVFEVWCARAGLLSRERAKQVREPVPSA